MKLICEICKNEFDATKFYIHLKEHKLKAYEYYYKYLYETNLCINCGCKMEFRHSIARSLEYKCCSKSCQVSYRNKLNSSKGINPFQSSNLKRDENGKSISHIQGTHKAISEGRHNFVNTGTPECRARLSKMHRKTALNQIANGNSVFSPGNFIKTPFGSRYGSSELEIKLGEMLNELGINNIPQYMDIRWKKLYQADYYLPDYNLILECDGDFKYINGQLKQYYIDRKNIIESTSGIKVINLKYSYLKTLSSSDLLTIILQSSTTRV